ncbi:hypothetical protein [Paenibacillus hamazuiensis]|uniref:hypothetical protein n=1 Tax=Paenibacillus hamazuiensis TaxID=2936508 RepID=UPI00200CB550|nr:hypothetical protein [Paenibacillus hamazuiensis]
MLQAGESREMPDLYTRATFQALVDAILPHTIQCEEELGIVPAAGAIQLGVDRFVIAQIDQSQFVPVDVKELPMPLSRSAAQMLDEGAKQLVRRGRVQHPLHPHVFSGGGLFSSLSRLDRLLAMDVLDRLDLPLRLLPPPFRNSPGMVQTMIETFHQLTMFGYYSEWVGYGSTRLFPPDYRQLEFFPPGWGRIGYPGPAFGYRDFRGFLLLYSHHKGEHSHD